MKFEAGVNFSPAFPCAKVMKLPALIAVVPSFWKSVPLVMFVILKCVTSAPSAALREITSPVADCVFCVVAELVTDGVSATGFTVTVAGTTLSFRPASVALVEACTLKPNDGVFAEFRFAPGVNFRPAAPSAFVMKEPLLIAVEPSFLKSVPPVMFVIL